MTPNVLSSPLSLFIAAGTILVLTPGPDPAVRRVQRWVFGALALRLAWPEKR